MEAFACSKQCLQDLLHNIRLIRGKRRLYKAMKKETRLSRINKFAKLCTKSLKKNTKKPKEKSLKPRRKRRSGLSV